MPESPFLEYSNITGLLATVALTANALLGMMLGTAYKKNRYWQALPAWLKKLDINSLHNLTAYITLLFVLLHPVLLLFDKSTEFGLIDIFFPINAPQQKLMVALGTIATYLIILVIITTQKGIKRKLGFRTWKTLHLLSYLTAALVIIHGIMLDPHLQNRPVDFFDGEKLVSEGCGLVLVIATILRYQYHAKHQKRKEKSVVKRKLTDFTESHS